MGRPSSSASSVTAGAMRSRSWPSRTTSCPEAALATECSACASMLRPARVCSTFGVSERMRVLAPAARTRTAASPCTLDIELHVDSRSPKLAPSPGLEPELSEPKSEVLPITPRRTDQLVMLVEATTLISVAAPDKEVRAPRARMTGTERRHQLIDVARTLFAERGYEGTSIEEIAQRANVSKPVVYEHFGGKEGLYAVGVDRVALALLTYVEERTDGFRILIRDSPAAISTGTYSSLLNDAVGQVSSILAGDFARRGLDPDLAPLYAQALV